MEPSVSRLDRFYHLRYRFPQLLNCSTIYPRRSPEGSELVLCGHERGLTVLWRGGNRRASNGARNGGQDAMMVDEGEDVEDHMDDVPPYLPIQQVINFSFDTAILQLSCLRLPQSSLQDALIHPELLREQVVVALSGADGTIRLLAFPLSMVWAKSCNALQEAGELYAAVEDWPNVQVRVVSKLPGPSNLPRSISIAITSSEADDEGEDAEESWEILVAHSSRHYSGKIYIHQVPLSSAGDSLSDSAPSLLWTVYLSSSAASIDLIVSSDASESTVAKIIASFDDGPLRVYELLLNSGNESGRWTIALSPGTEALPGGRPVSKGVIDARWALGGSIVVALLRSGEWLLYDTSLKTMAAYMSGAIAVPPGLRGRIGPSAGDKSPVFGAASNFGSKMVPMTPATRRTRQDALFHGKPEAQVTPSGTGGISIALQKRAANSSQDAESVVAWCGDGAILIADLATCWRNRVNASTDPFGGGIGGHARMLSTASLDGEMRTGVSIFAPATTEQSKFRARHVDTVITGQFSIIIVAAPLSQPQTQERVSAGPSQRASAQPPDDTLLLNAGELDVAGLDRMLDVIESKNTRARNGLQ